MRKRSSAIGLKIPRTPPRYLSVVVDVFFENGCAWTNKEKMKELVLKAAIVLGLPRERVSASRTIFGRVRGHVRVARGRLTPAKREAMERAKGVLDGMVRKVKWSKNGITRRIDFSGL